LPEKEAGDMPMIADADAVRGSMMSLVTHCSHHCIAVRYNKNNHNSCHNSP
jgi:hypothetical protein